MKSRFVAVAWRTSSLVLMLAGANLLFVCATVGAANAPAPAHKPGPAADAKPDDPWPPEIPQSVFTIPSNPKEGRNPFFPRSTFGAEPVARPRPSTVDFGAFVLNGITSPPKRTAMINGRTFEVGEEGEVRMPGGYKELIKCLEIRSDTAVIETHGQRRELHFRSGF